MAEIVDLDELVPEDIEFKYRDGTYRIPGDLKTEDTLKLYALLKRLANTEAKGTETELAKIIGQCEEALLPIFRVYQPDMEKLPFGAAGLGAVLRRVLTLIGLLQVGLPEGDDVDPPVAPTLNRAARRSTRTRTKPGSKPAPKPKKRSSGSSTR